MKKITLLLFLSVLSACSAVDDGKPSTKDLESALSKIIPDYFKITDFEIKAMENTGSEVDPRFISRFSAIISPVDTLYERGGFDDDPNFLVLILKEKTSKGKKVNIYGKTNSFLSKEKWVHDIKLAACRTLRING